jgi:spore coat protein H
MLHSLVLLSLLVPWTGCSDGGNAKTPDASAGAPADPVYDELFDDSIPHEFIIEISQAEWEGITQDMLDYAAKFPVTPLYTGDGREYRTDKYRRADFIYRRADGSEVKLDQVGIRTRGNESRRLPYQNGQFYKSHFKVKFDETFDMAKSDPSYAAIDQRRFAGLKALNFKWSRYNSWDTYANKSKINELFSYGLLSRAGIAAPRMSMGVLRFRIAGKEVSYGLYGIVEQVDKPFLARRFGNNDGDLYKCLYLDAGPTLTLSSIQGQLVGVKNVDTNYRPIYDLQTNESSSDHSALKGFVQQLGTLTGQALVDYLDASFDVDSFLRYLAMGIYVSNLDDYRFLANNYYLYFNPAGKIEFIPYDFDISLGTNWHGDLPYDEFINQDIFATVNLPAAWGDTSPRPLVDKVLAVDKYRTRYLDLLKGDALAANKLFVFSQYKAKFDQLFALYGDKTASDTVDPDPMGLAGYEQKYFIDKTKNVLGQLKIGSSGYEVE